MPESARWTAEPAPVAHVERLARELGLSPQAAAILVRRGYADPSAARSFLEGEERHDPFLFADMRAACDLILGHVRRGSRIVVHGDYDVDGVSSTAILVQRLRALGADPAWHIPSRLEDGYGLIPRTVERLAASGTGLLVTADCAITAVAEVEQARACGMDVVVTDHHHPAETLPACLILHPALSGYPFADLCAAGVAHKLSEALAAVAGSGDLEHDELDLVALATVCDVVPLHGENRRLVREGLRALQRTRRPGLRALMKISQLEPGAADEKALGFRLGPRLNAAGRVGTAEAALELVLTEDEERATQVADELDMLNRERRDRETRIVFAAEAARAGYDGDPAYVLAGEDWHPGVIGIVASRLAERHHRPVVIIGLDGDSGRGSGRSIPTFDLLAGLKAGGTHLARFGGHPAAAGLEVERGQIDAFRQAFLAHARQSLRPEDLIPVHPVDAIAPAGDLTLQLAADLRRLAPFGAGNREPALLVPAVRLGDIRPMGDEGQHSRLLLSGAGTTARAVAFRTPPRSLVALGDSPQDAVVGLERNEWRGSVEARPVVRALCPTEPGTVRILLEEPPAGASGPPRRVWDRRGHGIAGVAGELLQSGDPVVAVCADAPRRQVALARLIAGLAPGGEMQLTEWGSAVDPAAHLLAIDPPATGAPSEGSGLLVKAWGAPEVGFALSVAQEAGDLRTGLAEVYRALRDAGGSAEGLQLETILKGPRSRHPRVCARLLAMIAELGLGTVEPGRCTLDLSAPRVQLESSPTYALAQSELAEARVRLGREAEWFALDLPAGERVAGELA